jgi:hypothetical protein
MPLSPAIMSMSGTGTWSILAGMDLHDGHVTKSATEASSSALLKDLDAYYPPDCTIR